MTNTHSQPYINLLAALLAVVLGWAVAKVIWQAYTHWLGPTYTLDAPLKRTAQLLSSTVDLADTIGRGYLFGRQQKQQPAKPVPKEIPISSLNVQIKGILSMPKSAQSMAILSLDGAADKVFGIGAELKPGHKIENIVSAGIVVNHQGRLAMIRLPRKSLVDLNTTDLADGDAINLGDLRSKVLRNPLVLEQYISFSSYTYKNQFNGYQINPGKQPDIFYKLGMQENDIVVSVDGVKVGELAGRMDILNNLAIAKNLRLGIIRNGQKQQLVLDFNQ